MKVLAGAEGGGNREPGMWTLGGATIFGPGVRHVLVAHSFWSLPFPPLLSLPQARQTLEPKEGAEKPLGEAQTTDHPELLLPSPHS